MKANTMTTNPTPVSAKPAESLFDKLETLFSRHAAYFNANKGASDANHAVHFSMLSGQPSNTPIFPCFDFDPTEEEIEIRSFDTPQGRIYLVAR